MDPPPDLSDDVIIRTVRDITACRLPEDAKRERFEAFIELHPALFDMACMGPVDESMLRMMLRMRGRIAMNKITEDEAHTAVGVALAKKYVEPTLNSLPIPKGAASASDGHGQGQDLKRRREA